MDERTASTAAGFPLGTISLIFWLCVHYGAPLGTTWGGISAHVIAYYVLLIGVVIPLGILAGILALVLIVGGIYFALGKF